MALYSERQLREKSGATMLGGRGDSVPGISSLASLQDHQRMTRVIVRRQHHSSAFLRDWFSPS
jgi:hypothetical protein